MKLLWMGDAALTGFGTVTRELGGALVDLGVDVRFVSQNDLGVLEAPFKGRTVDLVSLPLTMGVDGRQWLDKTPAEALGNLLKGESDAVLDSGESTRGWNPDATVVLGDPGTAEIFMEQFGEAFDGLPTYHYVPIEGVGLPKAWGKLWKTMAPVAMSEFGADQIAQVIGIRPPVVYHGVDTHTFRPVSKLNPLITGKPPLVLNTKDDCKRAWLEWLVDHNDIDRVPQNWILRTDSHWPRKRYNSMIRALVPVLARNPSWAMVIHGTGRGPGGNMKNFLSGVPEPVRSQFIFTDVSGIPRDALVALYNASDLYVSTSAEGFGLTIAEALACGVPAVGCDYSAVPEVIGPAGKVIKSYLIDNEYDHYWCAIDEGEFASSVEYLMTHKTKRQDLGRLGPAHIRDNFRWDAAAKDFLAIIEATALSGVAA